MMSAATYPSDQANLVTQPSDVYDVIVVGASFAGLSFAGVAAARGLRVLVLERDVEVGHVVRTTGILISDVLGVLDVPARFLMNSVRRIQIQTPDKKTIEVSSQAFRFYVADITGTLRWMADEAQARGAIIRCGAPFLGATRADDGLMDISVGGPSTSESGGGTSRAPTTVERAHFLIGADGAKSVVARSMGLDQNTRLLAGAEWLVEGVEMGRDTFHLVMDHKMAPGYCVWLAPHDDIVALGVAGHMREFKPNESLQLAQKLFAHVADLSNMHVRQRKGGIIPIGGKLRHVYRDDKRGRALLLGDAAGLCGAATGGGIYPALISGRLAAQAVGNEVLNGTKGAVKNYLRDFDEAGRIGHYLQIEDWVRWLLNRMKSNTDVALLYGMFGSSGGHRILQESLFETPIISMDSSFFGVTRTLIGTYPGVIGDAVRVAVRRVTSRP